MDNTKYTIFDRAYFYQNTADYMYRIGNKDQMMEMQYKSDAVMGLIVDLGLEDAYNTWVKTGELK